MKPAYWYVSMLVVAFLYIYLSAIQIVRGVTLGNTNGLNLAFKYHNYEEMTTILRDISRTYSNLTAMYSIGRSVQGELARRGRGLPDLASGNVSLDVFFFFFRCRS